MPDVSNRTRRKNGEFDHEQRVQKAIALELDDTVLETEPRLPLAVAGAGMVAALTDCV